MFGGVDFAYEVEGVFGEVEYGFSVVGEGVDFSGAFRVGVPAAFDVGLLFEGVEKGVDGAGAKVDAEVFADFGDDLVTVHGFLVEELEYYHV